MTEPTRLTEADLERLLTEANFPGAWGLFRQTEVRALVDEVRRLRADYFDLIYQVQTKHPHESRHETAKRYIHERENQPVKAAQAEARDAS